MSSIKCSNCGLINFATETACKRCQADLSETGVDPSASVSALQYEREAAQTSGGVWRDQKKVVKHVQAHLPDRCLKCNSTDGLALKVYTLKHYPAYNIITALLIGFTRYQKVDIAIGLCSYHRDERKRMVRRRVIAIAAATVMFFLSIALDTPIGMIVGSLVFFFAAIVFIATLNTPVAIAKIKEPYIWLKGAGENYTSALPQWKGGQREALY